MIRMMALMVTGFVISYLFCALFAWTLNMGDWGVFLRIWFALWAIFWGGIGAFLGADWNQSVIAAKNRKQMAADKTVNQ